MSLVKLTTHSRRALRLRSLAPRIALCSVAAVLSLAGLRTIVSGPVEPPVAPRQVPGQDIGAGAFAEGFTRVYLSSDPDRALSRERELSGYLSRSLEPDGGLRVERPASVSWTAVVGQTRSGPRSTVTVAAQTEESVAYLAVPVQRDARGFLTVPSYPALVGPPATYHQDEAPEEEDVEDRGLRAVAARAVANYLAGDGRDLAADLSRGAVVSLPAQRLRVRSTEEVTWLEHGRRVAVLVAARDETGNEWTLRYELGVIRSGRWFVRSVAVDPASRGGV